MQCRILHYKTLTSTNDKAREFAKLGAREGIVILADYQTKGRGRFQRRWQSPRGRNLLFSVILRPVGSHVNKIPIITHILAMAVRNVLQKICHLDAQVKKPNDVLIHNKKISGILVQGSVYLMRVEYLIAGIGLNVNAGKHELIRGATSVKEETGKIQDLESLLEEILNEVGKSVEKQFSANGKLK